MSGNQSKNGKAYEHAVASVFSDRLRGQIDPSPAATTARNCFDGLVPATALKFKRTAKVACDVILEQETWLSGVNTPVKVILQTDAAGIRGDVRDIVLSAAGRSIGISCKSNHEALKHSRLSSTIDFVRDWGIHPDGCSDEYWSAVRPLFDELRQIKEKSDGKAKWVDEPEVPERFYWPLLHAWDAELRRSINDSADPQKACAGLIRYLFGAHDFYKVIGRHGKSPQSEVLGVNFQRTLSTKHTGIPKKLLRIDDLNGGQYSKTVRFDRGFSINFRIHSASSRVEPSLKFDVKALALPPALFFQTCKPA